MSKHTPGPWNEVSAPTASHDSRWIFSQDRAETIARIPWEMEQSERLANARLIAAAPELLEAAIVAKEGGDLSGRAYTLICAAIEKASKTP